MEQITNAYTVNDLLATSGQPTVEDFAEIAQAGYQVVINLAMPDSDNALPTEGSIVTGHGMSYIHLPVVWEAPTVANVDLFFKLMQALTGQKVWVHCALNWRVSCFVYLYQKHILQLPEDQARFPMNQIWQPDGVWAQLVVDVAERYG
jgi:protein tyrosine phosphatase (PTP) superfamily phosphohydrolase (DUF442 family)